MEYEVQRCTRHCASCGRQLAEGEEFYSALVAEGAEVRRYDYAVEEWSEPPPGAIGWWKSRMPSHAAKKPQLAPTEILLQLLAELESSSEQLDMRYVLALLLVRRRVLRLEDSRQDESGRETMVLYSPRDESTHCVEVVTPDDQRIEQIQDELSRLLFAGAM